MREKLIRYLLDELGAAEREELERRLESDAALREELAHLRTCFAAACDVDESSEEPPRGLAERTTERVATDQTCQAELSAVADPPAGALGWSLADLTVAGGVILAVSMLLFPALGDSRDVTRRDMCRNNQRQLGQLIALYAEDHGGYIPEVRPTENAGIFTVRLVDGGYVSADDLMLLLVCPGAELAEEVSSRRFVMRIPTFDELRSMTPQERAAARRQMSPMYAYRFPYRVGEVYHTVRDERRSFAPVLSDTSGSAQDGLMSPNHGGVVFNVLCRDGSVRSLTSCTVPGVGDDLFRNMLGMVAAGLGRQDAVLGRSEATPAMDEQFPLE